MTNAAPHHPQARLRHAHAKLQNVARTRGLERVFAMELFSVSLTVEEALTSGTRGLVEHALEEVRLAERHLQDTPAKPAPRAGSVKIGR